MPKVIKKYATGDEVPMSIEELLEAFPSKVGYYFDTYKIGGIVPYGLTHNK